MIGPNLEKGFQFCLIKECFKRHYFYFLANFLIGWESYSRNILTNQKITYFHFSLSLLT
jgi:hypothetical protein